MDKEVTFKQNRKPMPQAIFLGIFLFVLGAICAFLLAFVNDLTKDSIAENDKKTAEQENSSIIEEIKSIYGNIDVTTEDLTTATYRVINESEVKVSSIFSANDGLTLAFKIQTTNSYATFNVLVVLEGTAKNDIGTYTVKKVKVLDTYKPTTFGASVDNNFYSSQWGVEGSTINQVNGSASEDSTFEIVSGATYSSNSVKLAIRAAFAQAEEMFNAVKGGN